MLKRYIGVSTAVFLFALNAEATSNAERHIGNQVVITPNCLLNQVHVPYKTLAQNQKYTLVEVNESGINALADAKANHRHGICGGFLNVTDTYKNSTPKNAQRFLRHELSTIESVDVEEKGYAIQYKTQVEQLLKAIEPDNMWQKLTTLSAFHDRYANSKNGVEAANWIKTQVEELAKQNGHTTDFSVRFVKTGTDYNQPSVVAKLGEGEGPGIVIGGHMDTTSGAFSIKPGADDDGSGTVTVLETARVILSSGVKFEKPIYFIWYAAEEEGLVGSKYVVRDFKAKNIPVDAVIHFDMTGYANKNDTTMWLMDDNVNKELTSFLETLINTYVKQPVKHTRCGYACSDHASWTRGGFAASMPFESAMGSDNPDIHSSRDTIEKLSLSHMTDYAKLGVSFVVEMAHPIA